MKSVSIVCRAVYDESYNSSPNDAFSPGIAYGPTSYKKTLLQVLSRV
jgi:hypothetical protein